MTHVAVALGSNLGDRAAHLTWAVRQLASHLHNLRQSAVIEAAAVGVPDSQPAYLNAVVTGDTDLSAESLLIVLSTIEHERGRQRASFRAARTLDLDLIFYGDRVIQTDALTVPHPRFRERAFVLEPLASLEPDWTDPITGQTVGAMLSALKTYTRVGRTELPCS